MAILPRNLLKSFFEKGDKPSEAQFSSLIDSMLHSSEDHERLGLRVYDPDRTYLTGDAVLYNDCLYLALTNTTGVFNTADWRKVLAFGSLIYRGLWNAATNTPVLTSGTGTMGDYYIVSIDGSTNLDDITTWVASDYVIFNGTKWERAVGFGIDNQTAAEVPYDNTASGLAAADVQVAIDELSAEKASLADVNAFAKATDHAINNVGDVSGAVSLDLSYAVTRWVLTGNVTSVTFSNPPTGSNFRTGRLLVYQDATGGRTITFSAGTIRGTVYVNPAANDKTTIYWEYSALENKLEISCNVDTATN